MTCTGLGALSSGVVCSLVAGKAQFDVVGMGLGEQKKAAFVAVFFGGVLFRNRLIKYRKA